MQQELVENIANEATGVHRKPIKRRHHDNPVTLPASRPDTGDLDPYVEGTRILHHKANLMSLKDDALHGKLVELEAVEKALVTGFVAARIKFQAIPSKIQNRYEISREIIEYLTFLIDETLHELADLSPDDISTDQNLARRASTTSEA
jgi:phage terminase Nu1 subunit (DNA packaging protein)